MRDQTDNFTAENNRQVQAPRYAAELRFSTNTTTPTQNLLTYSEQFDNAAWVATLTPVVTANVSAPVAPDGTATADTIEDDNNSSTEYLSQTVTAIDEHKHYTFSVYIGKEDDDRETFFPVIELEFGTTATETNRVGLDLLTGEIEIITDSSTDVIAFVEDIDSDWWRVGISAQTTNTINNQAVCRVVPAYGASATWAASGSAQGTITAWGAQLVEGDRITAYSKIEATADTSTTGLPRVNLLEKSEDLDFGSLWTSIGTSVVSTSTETAPDTSQTAFLLDDDDAVVNREGIYQDVDISSSNHYVLSCFVKKDTTARATRFCGITMTFQTGGTPEINRVNLDTSTGETDLIDGGSDELTAGAVNWSKDYWRLWIRGKPNDGALTEARCYLYPCMGSSSTWVLDTTATGSAYFWGAQLSEYNRLLPYFKTGVGMAIRPDDENLIRYWLASHDDTLLPPGEGANCIPGTIKSISGQSQQIKPDTARHTIGSVTFSISDVSGCVTELINDQLEDGDGLNRKRIRLYKGHELLTDWDDYSLRLTYLIRAIDYHNGVYNIHSDDIQRTEKTTIFEPDQGALTKSIKANDDEIPITIANGADKFQTFTHDANYSANPSVDVGYIIIDDEVICHSGWTDGTYTALQVVERGALNTKKQPHTITQTNTDQKKRVTEYVYLEGPAIALIYAILTGDIYGQAETLPDGWHLDIDPEFVRDSDFYGVGDDLWDISDDSGRRARFIGTEPTEGKSFIETELLVWLNCFMPVYSDGRLGLKRLKNVTPDSGFDAYLDEDEIISYGALRHDMKSLINSISIKWNWIQRIKSFSKTTFLVDTESIAKHSKAKLKEYEFKGVFNGVHSDSDIFNYFSAIRDRYANPPELLQLEVMPEWDRLEVGDTVRAVCSQIRDYAKPETLDRVFEIQQVKTDWITGKVWLQLFGGIEKATEVTISSSNVMSDLYYTTGGTELSTVLTISGNAITANGTLTGAASNANAVFYYDGDLTLNSGVTLTINRNVLLRIKGTFTVNGTINVDGSTSDRGTVGATYSGYSAAIGIIYVGAAKYDAAISKFLDSTRNSGKFQQLPVFNVLNPNGLSITGIPTSLSGRKGVTGTRAQIGQGAAFATPTLTSAAGGAGGAGGGGLVVVSRGGAMGASGTINTDGSAGTVGSSATVDGFTIYGQTGGGGFPGGVLWLIDGNYSFPAFDSGNFIATRGGHPEPSGVDWYPPYRKIPIAGGTGYGQVISDSKNYFEACTRIQFIPAAENGYKWMPEDERGGSLPRRDLIELLFANLNQLFTIPDGPFRVALYKGGLFCCAGLNSGADTEIMTSPDGRVWTEQSNPGSASSDDALGGCVGDGYFVVVCGNTGVGSVLSSTDGVTWSKVSPTNNQRFQDVAFGDDIFVLVGQADGTDASIFTATDPAGTWTERSNPKNFNLNGVCYSADLGLWCAVGSADGSDAYIVTASDPTSTWTERSNPTNDVLQSVAYGNGVFVAGGGNSTPYIIYSTDGITWTEISTYPLTTDTVMRVRFIDGVFFAVGTYVSTTVGAVLWSSVDGITWVGHNNPAPQQLRDIAYDGSRFVLPVDINAEGVLITPRVEAT